MIANLICKIFGCKTWMQAVELNKSGLITGIIIGCERCGGTQKIRATEYLIEVYKEYFYLGN